MQKGLGRGLEALISSGQADRSQLPKGEEVQKIPLDKIKPNKYQARKKFNTENLKSLAESIREKGVISPVTLSPSMVPGEYELIFGERRFRASKIAGLKEIPAIIKKISEKDRALESLIENLQRDDLNPMEEARIFRRIIDEFKFTQEELAKSVGKDRSVVTNTLRLLGLSELIQDLLEEGLISGGHARTLAGIEDKNKQKEIAHRIQRENLTVREVEKIVQSWKQVVDKKPLKRKRAAEVIDLENNLQKTLGTKVQVFSRGKKGKIVIHFYSLDYLDRLLKILRTKVK